MSKKLALTPSPRVDGRNWFERLLFGFMGPAQLGDPDEPTTPRASLPAAPCPTCGQDYAAHPVVRTGATSHTHCP